MCDYTDKLWVSDMSVLYKKWYMIFPCKEHTRKQNVTSIVRFIIVSSILLSAMKNDIKYFLIGNILFLLFTLSYQIFYVKRSYFTERFGNIDEIRNKLTPNYYKFAKEAKLIPENNCKQDSIYSKSSETHGKGTVTCKT